MQYIMATYDWLRQRFIEPLKERQHREWRAAALAEGLAEGRAEAFAEMRAWDKRRKLAIERGEDFSEEPPYMANGDASEQ